VCFFDCAGVKKVTLQKGKEEKQQQNQQQQQ